jgi:hypothetical protein
LSLFTESLRSLVFTSYIVLMVSIELMFCYSKVVNEEIASRLNKFGRSGSMSIYSKVYLDSSNTIDLMLILS